MSEVFQHESEQEWLKSLLKERIVKVVFTKKDGSQREMNCTLKEDLIPTEMKPKGSGRAHSPDSISVFDTDVSGWRSFRYDSVKELDFKI